MIVVAAILLIMGFFFPPAWVGFLGVCIYFFASRKSRRADEVEVRVKRMVSAGRDYAHFSDLYYEAAKGYAVEKGAKAADDQSASAVIVVDRVAYNVVFSRGTDGGTSMIVRTQSDVEKELKSHFSNIGL